MAKKHIKDLQPSKNYICWFISGTKQSLAAMPHSSFLDLITRTGPSNQVRLHQSPRCPLYNSFGPHRLHHLILGLCNVRCCIGRAAGAAHRSGAWQPQAAPGWTRPAAGPPRASAPDRWVPLLFHRNASAGSPPRAVQLQQRQHVRFAAERTRGGWFWNVSWLSLHAVAWFPSEPLLALISLRRTTPPERCPLQRWEPGAGLFAGCTCKRRRLSFHLCAKWQHQSHHASCTRLRWNYAGFFQTGG